VASPAPNFLWLTTTDKTSGDTPVAAGLAPRNAKPQAIAMAASQSNSGIVTDSNSGERHIPESVRADGTTRKAIKIRPGYRPPEDVEVYKNRAAETFRTRGSFIPGADGLKEAQEADASGSAASNKNAKRREARKKAKAASEEQDGTNGTAAVANGHVKADANSTQPQEAVDPEVEREKKARNLKKKLKQAKELKLKKETGESLLPEQFAKVIKINELIRELDKLGFDADGEPKTDGSGNADADGASAAGT
jgi:partner of Y14 and mago